MALSSPWFVRPAPVSIFGLGWHARAIICIMGLKRTKLTNTSQSHTQSAKKVMKSLK